MLGFGTCFKDRFEAGLYFAAICEAFEAAPCLNTQKTKPKQQRGVIFVIFAVFLDLVANN
jgi:hypothetical protein